MSSQVVKGTLKKFEVREFQRDGVWSRDVEIELTDTAVDRTTRVTCIGAQITSLDFGFFGLWEVLVSDIKDRGWENLLFWVEEGGHRFSMCCAAIHID